MRRDLYKEHHTNVAIEQKIDIIEQSSKQCNVRIVDLPETTNDDNLTRQVIQLLNLANITEEDIQSSYRMAKKRECRTSDVIVKFTSKKKRDIYFAKRKATPKGIDNKKAFINDDLTEFRSKLFYDA